MTTANRIPRLTGELGLPVLGIVGFCLFQARDLVLAWQHAPLERFSAFLFLLWLLPLRRLEIRREAAFPPLLLIGLALAVVRSLTQLNVLAHLGIACALASLPLKEKRPGDNWRCALFLVGALAWMPAFGWAVPIPSEANLLGLRLLIVAAAVIAREMGRRLP